MCHTKDTAFHDAARCVCQRQLLLEGHLYSDEEDMVGRLSDVICVRRNVWASMDGVMETVLDDAVRLFG